MRIMYAEYLVEGGGFEPPKASPTDLQSVPFGLSGTPPSMSKIVIPLSRFISRREDSNPRLTDYKSVTLPSELRRLIN